MSAAAWGAFLALAALLVGYSGWIYRRRELPVRGRGLLAGLRSLAFVVLLLLLWNPSVPGEPAFGGARDWMLLDASASMAVPSGAEGGTPWDSALAVVGAREGGVLLATFGDGVEAPADEEGVAGSGPRAGRSALAPALERAAEAGARSVTVVSDLRLEDPVAVEAALERLGLAVSWVDVGGDVRNAGVRGFEAPPAVRADEGPSVEVVAFASGASEGDSLRIEVLEEGRLVASRAVAAPSGGRSTRAAFDLPAPSADGTVRYEARVALDGDASPDDDAAAAYVAVAPEEGALVLVSLRPDFEPRFLLPVLAGVTALRPRGYLRVGNDRFLPFGGEDGGGSVSSEEVARVAASARLLVLHGVGEAPEWVAEAATAVPRLLVLPTAPDGAALGGLSPAPPRPGEWYVSEDLPASPLAAEISGAPFETLPPLSGAMAADGSGAQVVFGLQLRGTGPALPGLVLTAGEGRRSATALASGFWRWAFRPGGARETYRRLWSGVAGWLLAEPTLARGGGVAPVDPVVPSGEAPAWTAGTAEVDSVSLRVARGDTVVLDTAVAAGGIGTFRTPPLPPGTYRWSAVAGSDSASGRFDVTSPAELAHPRIEPGAQAGGAAPGTVAPRVRRPVRTHPLPFLLLLALLAGEWTLRRRRGLR